MKYNMVERKKNKKNFFMHKNIINYILWSEMGSIWFVKQKYENV